MRSEADEQVLYRGQPCWQSMVGFHAKGLVAAVLTGAVAGIATSSARGQVRPGWVALAVVAVFGLVLVLGALRRATTTYTATDRRLVVERGLLGRAVQEARLERVQNVVMRQSLRQRLLRVGSVHFDTAAGAGYDICFHGVARPRELARLLDRAVADFERPRSWV